VVAEGTHELQDGVGNGITGDDETSEILQDTWALETTASPGVTPF
jgi:hypothetical protein